MKKHTENTPKCTPLQDVSADCEMGYMRLLEEKQFNLKMKLAMATYPFFLLESAKPRNHKNPYKRFNK
jgi:hypothetical protein